MKGQELGNARDRILERLNFHVNRLETPDRLPQLPRWGLESPRERADHFKRKLQSAGIKAYEVEEEKVIKAVTQILTQRKTLGLLMGSGGWEHHESLQNFLTKRSIKWELWNDQSKVQQYASKWSAITYAYAGIAETASLVLWHDAAQPQAITTSTPHLIVLVRQSVIKNQFIELVEGVEWTHPPSALSMISGNGKHNILGTNTILNSLGPQITDVIIIKNELAPSLVDEEQATIKAPNLSLQ